MLIYLIISTLTWGIAEIFYKRCNSSNEKYSHLRTTIFVGLFFGIYATVVLFTQGIDLKSFPINFLIYLPVAASYIISMVCSYYGVRFLEESIADPIENSSIAIVPILCAIILKETFSPSVIIGICISVIGVICLSIFDKKGKSDRTNKYGKKIAIIAITMPICYMLLDAVGTFLDVFYTSDVANTLLVNVTEDNIENTANCAYEFTFFLVSIILIIFLKIKKEKVFDFSKHNKLNIYKILAAVFETIGQATYLFALSSGGGIAAVILGAGTVIVSLILSRLFLKEKLTIIQYIFIAIVLGGIITLSLSGV